MNYILDFNKQVLTFEGKKYNKNELEKLHTDLKNRADFTQHHLDLYEFLKEWFDEKDYIEVRSSGSTGVPKIIRAKKDYMMQSARRTCSALGLTEGNKALLCMPLQFIGSKMVVVRALIAQLDLYLVCPSVNPFKVTDIAFDFVAMTPQQAAVTIKNSEEKQRLAQVKNLLLGGMAVMPELEKELNSFPHNVWLSYGMTETLSHIALRKLNGQDASSFFTPFADVELSLTKDERLVIHAPFVCDDILTTNDRALLLENKSFQILGRIDNVVNSGGIKIQIEEVEEKLSSVLDIDFQISALPHEELGEQLVLLTDKVCDDWKEKCSILPKYNIPKLHIQLEKLPFTDSGKPDRHNAKKMAKEHTLTH